MFEGASLFLVFPWLLDELVRLLALEPVLFVPGSCFPGWGRYAFCAGFLLFLPLRHFRYARYARIMAMISGSTQQ